MSNDVHMQGVETVVAPQKNFSIRNEGNKLILSAQVRNRAKIRVYLIISALLMIPWVLLGVGFFVAFFNEDVPQLVRVMFLLITLVFLLFYWSGSRKAERVVTFDDDGIIANNKKYLYCDIEQIGCGDPDTTIILGSAESVGVMAAQKTFGGSLWIQHGNKYVALLDGLSQADAEMIYDRVSGRVTRG